MACTNCFSGCVSTTSDKCVKYTGNDITFLNIHNGDSLEAVEKAITDWLATVLNAEGIFPVIEHNLVCSIIHNYIPVNPTLVDILTAIIRTVCDIEVQILAEHARIDTIEANYTVGCVTVATDAGTHAVLQAVITKLCVAVGDITKLTNLFPLYTKTEDLDAYILNYLNTITTLDKMYTKMVPYAIYPFYPSSTFMSGLFGSTGEGLGTWEKIYLCNGANNTPDLRGYSLIGTTDMGGTISPAMSSRVNPADGNPTYNLGSTEGTNNVILSPSEIAAHTHVATTVITDPGHYTHIKAALSGMTKWDDDSTNTGQPINRIESLTGPNGNDSEVLVSTTTLDKTGLDGTNVSVTNANNNAGAVGHENVHPVHACYYIMYRP